MSRQRNFGLSIPVILIILMVHNQNRMSTDAYIFSKRAYSGYSEACRLKGSSARECFSGKIDFPNWNN